MGVQASVPKPRWRLWRTLLKRPRDLDRFVSGVLSPWQVMGSQPQRFEGWNEFILLDDRVTALHRDGTFSHRVRYVAVLNGSAELAAWDGFHRVYDPRQWRPTVRRAKVRLPNGGEFAAIVTDRPAGQRSRLRLLNVAFHHLQPGVILDYEEQHDFFKPSEIAPGVWGSFYQQTAAPCDYRRFVVAVAQPFALHYQLHHTAATPKESVVGRYRVYEWQVEQQPGIHWDNWNPPAADFLPWVEYSTLPSWDPVVRHFAKQLSPDGGSASVLDHLAATLTDGVDQVSAKLNAIYQYVAHNVRYGRPERELGMQTVRPMTTVTQELRGDCKDKSVLLVGLCQRLCIPAKIVLVWSRQNGRSGDLPAPHFDHAIVLAQLDGQELWMDPAAGPFRIGDLPYHDQGTVALVLDGASGKRVEVPVADYDRNAIDRVCRGRLGERGDLTAQVVLQARGERAAWLRNMLLCAPKDHHLRIVQQFVGGEIPGASLSDLKANGKAEDLSQEFRLEFALKLAHCGRRIQNLMVLRIPWSERTLCTGPFTQLERATPLVGQVAQGIQESHELELPAGFRLYGPSHDVRQECPWASYECSVRAENGLLICRRRLMIRGGQVPADRFAELKTFWNACAQSDHADIVLVQGASP